MELKGVNVPLTKKESSLQTWVTYQRKCFWKGTLGETRKALLEKIGFRWARLREEKIARVARYVAAAANPIVAKLCDIPAIGAANPEEKEILSWLASQHKNGLSEDQILHAEQLRLQIQDRIARVKWRNNFQSLKDYAESHGGKANFRRNTDNRGQRGNILLGNGPEKVIQRRVTLQ